MIDNTRILAADPSAPSVSPRRARIDGRGLTVPLDSSTDWAFILPGEPKLMWWRRSKENLLRHATQSR